MTDFADLAHPYQATANLDVYQRGGHDRVVLKATQGRATPTKTGYVNPLYAQWAARCAALNLPFGAYHYATPDDAAAQAAHFLGTVDAGHMPWWLIVDCEWDEPKNATPADGRHVADLVGRLANRGAESGWIYGSPFWIQAAGLLPSMLPPDWRILWLASYGTSTLKIPAGWGPEMVAAWQYTNAASTPGVPNPCDRSRVMREWLPSGAPMAEIVDALNAATAEGYKSYADMFTAKPGGIVDILRGQHDFAARVEAGLADLKTLFSGLLKPDHPAQQVITDPIGDLETRLRGLTNLADATRLLSALSTRMAQLIPSSGGNQ